MKPLNRSEYKSSEARKCGSAEVRSSAETRKLGDTEVAGSGRDVWVLRVAPKAEDNTWHSGRIKLKLSFCFLLITACCLLLASCAPQMRPDRPNFESLSLDDALAQYKKISSINTVIGIEYEKNDAVMQADGSLFISPDKLALRIYYLGFLQGEINEKNGEVKSKPKIDRNKSELLVNGLKSSLFWWNISDYVRTDTEHSYELRNPVRKVVIDKQSLLPVEQTVTLDNGDLLTISYGRPERRLTEDGKGIDDNSPLGWYPGRLKIQLGNHIVRISVKSYEITR
jgi:hypothetical protein